MIALGRLLLALFFVLASFRGLEASLEYPRAALALELGYVAFAVATLALTWSNWWRDQRLKLPSHLVDLFFFVALDLAAGLPVTSPFFIFFVFLVLSAAARWGWRAGMWTGAAATLLFVTETVFEIFAASLSGEQYLYAVVRGGHLVALSFMLSWFGMTHLSRSHERTCTFTDIKDGEDPVLRALTYFRGCLGGSWAAMVWVEPEEPWVHMACLTDELGYRTGRAGPEEFPWLVAPELHRQTFLFDLTRRRALFPHDGALRRLKNVVAINPELAGRLPFVEGIGTPIDAQPFAGHIFTGGMDGMNWEHLPNARRCALDLARGFERWGAMRLIAETSESEARLRVARDLHDSISQAMAGLGLKLRAARTTTDSAEQRDRELQGIEEELVLYQQKIHTFIDDLRRPRGGGSRVDLNARLNEVAAAIRRQWSIEVDATGDHLAAIPKLLGDEVVHLLNEASANAVRHGGATQLFLSAELANDCLCLVVQDNGSGFPEAGSFDDFTLKQKGWGPRSIIERVQGLGGTVSLVSGEEGALVTIVVPLGTLPS